MGLKLKGPYTRRGRYPMTERNGFGGDTSRFSRHHTKELLFSSPSSSSSSVLSNLLAHTKMAACFRSIASLTHSPRDFSRSGIVLSSCSVLPITHSSSFIGSPVTLPRVQPSSRTTIRPRKLVPITMMVKPTLQFIQGTDEMTIPDVKLTRSRDGSNGMALFSFDQPSVFDSSGEVGEITGLYMIDEEGVIQSTDVNARFVNGKPEGIVAKHVMRTPKEWDRFMRFMERYSNQNGLQFVKKQ